MDVGDLHDSYEAHDTQQDDIDLFHLPSAPLAPIGHDVRWMAENPVGMSRSRLTRLHGHVDVVNQSIGDMIRGFERQHETLAHDVARLQVIGENHSAMLNILDDIMQDIQRFI
jgi:hypothetical protein